MKIKRLLSLLLLVNLFYSCNDKLVPTLPSPSMISIDKIIDSSLVNIKFGQEIYIEKKIIIKFESLIGDSRCPLDVVCVWEGDGSVQLKLTSSKEEFYSVLHTTLYPREITFYGYRIILKELNPYPKSTERIKEEDYSINIMIKR